MEWATWVKTLGGKFSTSSPSGSEIHIHRCERGSISTGYGFKLTLYYRFTELKHAVINEHAHIFTWEGSDQNLKPLLLMAHSDVVPVTTWTTERWTHEPFSGHYDGKYIWGRGSEDDKANVVAILSTLDLLLASGFQPSRTIIMALGFDEEGGAEKSYGARCLAEEILRQYGKDGIELIVS